MNKNPHAIDSSTDAGRRSLLRLGLGAGAAGLGGVLLAACGGGTQEAAAGGREGAQTRVVGNCSSKGAAIVDATGAVVGFVDILVTSTGGASIQVFPQTALGCTLTSIKLWVGADLSLLPVDGTGQPRWNDLPIQQDLSATNPSQSDIVVPTASLGLTADALSCATTNVPVYVVGQVVTSCGSGVVRGYETPNGNGTYNYAFGTLCCDDPVVLGSCQTAFAKGSHVFVTDSGANPEGLPSLGLTRNRWGWAIRLTGTGTTTYPIYAGAGLNRIASGTRVGSLIVEYSGSQAKVTYSLAPGVTMTEAHLYAGDAAPRTIAPGQFGNNATFSTPASSHTFTVPLADSNGDGAVWLIAHAVVC